MSDDSDLEIRFTLRMPATLRDDVAQAASDAGRSMNGEIVHRIEQSFSQSEATEHIKRLELEKKYLQEYLAIMRDQLAFAKDRHRINRLMLSTLAQGIRQYAEGDDSALTIFIEQEKREPYLASLFELPPEEVSDEDSL